jgi:hypothetical protein
MSADDGEFWIPVTTSSGMFSSEYAVSLKLADGQDVSFFVDEELIKENNGDSLLKVFLVNDDPDQHKRLVLLPTETFETASRWVEVSRK